ncbi:phage head protein [Paenibacillus sp. P3E]|uniref:Mu-like prophage major head subunit gpT family protein n=1 Tax=Paenibacillus sp. P3E TaxID=1349435 RepID=UPI00093D3057|nr:Mu-like prophage major head subunit gpT family protein [Paenibacillus sp. P3E]OKP81636.1 phage head protein [Paenibacillus sp. P3E]
MASSALQWDKNVLEPVFRELYTREMTNKKDYVPSMYDVQKSDKATESVEMIGGEGLMEDWKFSNNQVKYEDVDQLWQKYFTHSKYSLGREIDRDFVDDLKLTAIRDRIRSLADAVYKTQQMQGTQWLNNGILTTTAVDYRGRTYNAALPDGKSLFATDHPYSPTNSTDTQSNKGVAELSIDTFDAAFVAMQQWKDDKGNLMAAMGDTLFVPPALRRIALQIAGLPNSEVKYEPGSADHNANVYADGSIKVVVNPFFTNSKAWVLADSTRMMNAMKWYNRRLPETGSITDFDTEMAKYKVVKRCSFGTVDWAWGYGNFPA